ncbi:hypothetical protein BLS_002758 [Venturia inaequalis]|uniref:Uncharacterized protein n=1 Tax=Venturia inaequalis TaxID=5025 RepID=A0A8H3UQB2_VENIN|nr:hypothetical protein BLS_002758 [Venturia inaequalis]KAE9993917.1 hypothetical protein EG327_002541 [Venturia inaequalis]
MAPALDRLSLDILFEITDHLQEFDTTSGERWHCLTPESRTNILNARAVCRGFRDTLWLAYSNALAEKSFYLVKPDLDIIHNLTKHPVLRHLTKKITFGGECFSKSGLDLIDHVIDTHPVTLLGGDHTDESWQLGLAYLADSNLSQVAKARDSYSKALQEQEVSWQSGKTLECLKSCLTGLPQLRSCPALAHVRVASQEWQDLRRISEALGAFEGLVDFRLSSFCNISLPRLIPKLCRDEQYHADAPVESEPGLQECLRNAPGLKTLDVAIKCSNEVAYNSKILAQISVNPPSFRLEHLVLERATMTVDNLMALLRPHLPTLRTLILIYPWLRPGKWESFLKALKRQGVYLDYLELYKPSQGAIQYYDNMDWIDTKWMTAVSKESKLVKFQGEFDEISGEWLGGCETWAETWDNTYPRQGRR